jgi:hypothetical protein
MVDGTLDERSPASPAVATSGHAVTLAWTGTDFHLNVIASGDGHRFIGKQRLRYTSSARVSVSSTRPGAQGSDTETVALGPALAATPTGLCIAWTGTDRRLNAARDPLSRSVPVTLKERSDVAPALSQRREELLLAWTGTDRHVNLAVSSRGQFGEAARLEPTTSVSPAVCAVGNELVLAWTGTDRHLNLATWRGGSLMRSVRLDETTSEAPAVCAIGREVILAWTGTDRHLNIRRGVTAA